MCKVLGLLLVCFGINFSHVAYAQKLPLTVDAYSQWNDFKAITMSGDGAWVSYELGSSTSDTLYLQNVKSSKKHIFPKCKGGLFSPDTRFFVFSRNDSLQLFDLKKDPMETVNLSEKSNYQTIIRNMRNICRQEMIAAHDDLDINLTNWGRKPNQKVRGK